MYKIILEKNVEKFLLKQKGSPIIGQFQKALQILAISPYENTLDIKTITGLPNTYRLRLGKYRFLYEVLDNQLIISVTDAGSRGSIYK